LNLRFSAATVVNSRKAGFDVFRFRRAPSPAGHPGKRRRRAAQRSERYTLWMMAVMLPLVILSQFFRSSLGVIAPDLMVELRLTADELGLLSGAFFLIFAALQVPIGILLDRFGGRTVLPAAMVLAVAGSLLFAAADGFAGVLAGRLLIGIGCAGLMIGSLTILGRWCPPSRFATAMSILFAGANAGGLIATRPLAEAASVWGWRASFFGLALIAAALSLLFYLVVRDAPPEHHYHRRTPERLSTVVSGVRELFRLKDLLCVLPMVAIGYASSVTILGLWGGPYLSEAYGLAEVPRGNALSAMAIATILGTFAFGPLDRRFGTRRGVVTVGALATIVPLAILAAAPRSAAWHATLLLALFGFLGSYSLVVMAHGLALVPDRLAGRGAAVLNTALMGGAGLLQALTGRLMGAFPDRQGDAAALPYALLFTFLVASIAAALAVYRRTADVVPDDAPGARRAVPRHRAEMLPGDASGNSP
jgi:predicted MFS family arabinose efflux permease